MLGTLLQLVLSVPKPEISKLRRNKVPKRQLDSYGSPAAAVAAVDTYGSPAAAPVAAPACDLQVNINNAFTRSWSKISDTQRKIFKQIGKCAFEDSTLNDNELLKVKEVKRGATFTSLIFY